MILKKVLIVSVCKERLHYYEFVKPIENILLNLNLKFDTLNYNNLKDINDYEKIIICGTGLKDNDYLKKNNINYFNELKNYSGSVLGICAGMQILGILFGGKIIEKSEICFKDIFFKNSFLNCLNKKYSVYLLHKKSLLIDDKLKSKFDFYDSDFCYAMKHKFKDFYGVMFHPEVRNKDLIENFCLN